MENEMIGKLVEARGCYVRGNDGQVTLWFPGWLKKGIHRITKVKRNLFGTLVKTDKMNIWLNLDWFAEVEG
jgi:hypothetical protein